ncbi:unnamed protein product [Trichobilharzia szidati]|nr:unnamed protein product [Trichobilharzia szidati]
MNLSGRFFVKSNYIRAAKDEWVLCDVRLLTDDTDTFLCIKSLPSSILLNGTNNYSESDDGKIPEKSPYRVENFATRPFTALCNLSEYKSCSMRTETVNSSASFALKLVPSGVFGNKKLLIATEDENEITTWLAICKACIGKKSRNGSSAQRDLACNMGTLSKSGSFMSLKPNSQACESEFDDALMDNEVYEAYSSEDKIPAVLEEAGDWVKLHLCQPDCYLRLTTDRLEVLDFYSHKPIHWFPYLLIRRFGAANGVLRVDAGRRCSTGDGKFFFRCSPPNGQPVDALVTQIRQLALEAKQRTKRSQMTSSNLELNVNNSNNANNGDISSGNHIKGTSFSHTTENHLDNDHMDSIHGTLPRARSKRAKVPGESSVHRSSSHNVNGGGSGSSTECIPPKATPEPSDDADPNALPSNAEVFKATPCKAPKSSPEPGNASNLYDNLPRPPRRGSRLPGAVNVLPLPTRSHKQKESNLQTSSSTNGTIDSRNSSDTLDDLVDLNSKHIGSPTSSPRVTSTTTPPAVTPITPSTVSTSALTPSPITPSSAFMFSRLSSSSSTSASSALKNEKVETPSIPPHSSITTLNHIPSYNKNHETNTTSSTSSINFIDSSETKSSEASSCSPSPSPLTATTTTITATPTTPSSNSMVKSLIQSYTSISQSNSNQVSNGYHENGMKNRLKPSSLSVPTTISSTSLSLQSPSSLSASFAINNNNTNTTGNEYDNSAESRTSIHNTSNKLINSTGIMRVPLSTNTHSAGGHSENNNNNKLQANFPISTIQKLVQLLFIYEDLIQILPL